MEDSNFKTVRKGLIIICLLVISLFLLKIEISNTKLSLPFLGGANINEPKWLFPIIYSFLIYYIWKYLQYLFFEHQEGNLLAVAQKNFVSLYAKSHRKEAEKKITEELQNSNYKARSFNDYEYVGGFYMSYSYTVGPDGPLVMGKSQEYQSTKLRIPIFRHLPHYIWTQPEFTTLFLPIILLLITIIIVILPEWDGGLGLWYFVK